MYTPSLGLNKIKKIQCGGFVHCCHKGKGVCPRGFCPRGVLSVYPFDRTLVIPFSTAKFKRHLNANTITKTSVEKCTNVEWGKVHPTRPGHKM